MEHVSTRPFEGDTAKAFDLIERIFTSNGYVLDSRDAWSLRLHSASGSGSKKPFPGASRVEFSSGGGNLIMRAAMEGARKIGAALFVFPLALGLVFLVLFGILFGEMGPRFIVMISLGPVLPWVLMGPLLMRWLRRRSGEALDKLLESIVKAAST